MICQLAKIQLAIWIGVLNIGASLVREAIEKL
jgi:hypothetical protein